MVSSQQRGLLREPPLQADIKEALETRREEGGMLYAVGVRPKTWDLEEADDLLFDCDPDDQELRGELYFDAAMDNGGSEEDWDY